MEVILELPISMTYLLNIEYEQRLFTNRPIDCLTNNIVLRLWVIFIERLFYN